MSPKRQMSISKKICMLGTFGVGKTSLVRRFVQQVFDDSYLSTIGVQIFQKEVSLQEPDINIKLILWDLANIESLTPAVKNYFQGAAGAIVVFDLPRSQSLATQPTHLHSFLDINTGSKVVFSGNKMDLMEATRLPSDELAKIASQYKAPYFLTSAKTGENVESLFETLAKSLVSK